MSSELAMSVRGLTKEYRIARQGARHNRITDAAVSAVKGLIKERRHETFRAVDDVSFDIKKGEVVGVIGRNGAGKSTLLKILSRITEPTRGEIHLFGRVGSLLEVGTGFHPELTGRENIYLNGAILGMRKREIDGQFDEIVAFAEVEKFLDTPVKRYSSGMYVRLAFAVAAHLNPEILIVDEVLAVGDAQFQQKCLGKMRSVSQEDGRTVLFVSHNMSAIETLCDSGILLARGALECSGPINKVIHEYRVNTGALASVPVGERKDRTGSGAVRVVAATIFGDGNSGYSNWTTGLGGTLSIELETGLETLSAFRVAVSLSDRFGNQLTDLTFRGKSVRVIDRKVRVTVHVPSVPLKQGDYYANIYCEANGGTQDWIEKAVTIPVVGGLYGGKDYYVAEGWESKGLIVEHGWTLDSD